MSTAKEKYFSSTSTVRLERVLAAARRLIDDKGIEGLTIRALATKSRVSPVTLYNRFGNKDNIISLVVIDNMERLADTRVRSRSSGSTPLAQLIKLIGQEEAQTRDQRALVEALLKIYFTHGNDRELPDLLYRMLSDRIRPLLLDMQTLKMLDDWTDVELLSGEITDRVLGVIMNWSQGRFSAKTLLDRLLFSALSCLASFSKASQLVEIERNLKDIQLRLGSAAKRAISAEKKKA